MTKSELILDAAKKNSLAAKAIELFEADSSTLEVVEIDGATFLQITQYGATEPINSLTVVGGIDGVINSLQSQLSIFY